MEDIVVGVVIVVAILTGGFLIYQDQQHEAEMSRLGLCSVREMNPNGGTNWVYRPCASLPK